MAQLSAARVLNRLTTTRHPALHTTTCTWVQIYPSVYMVIFCGIAFFGRSRVAWQRTGELYNLEADPEELNFFGTSLRTAVCAQSSKSLCSTHLWPPKIAV